MSLWLTPSLKSKQQVIFFGTDATLVLRFGKWGALQAIPAAISEIFWNASILGALGSTLQVGVPLKIEKFCISLQGYPQLE